MTHAPAAPRPRRTPRREDVAVLATVTYNADRSTPYNELYEAQSDSEVGKVYEVRHDIAAGTWTCHQCIAASFGNPCKHVKRAQRKRAVRWWSALMAGQPDWIVARERDRHAQRIADGWGDADDLSYLDFAAIRLGRKVAA